jgi:hypothetical protein
LARKKYILPFPFPLVIDVAMGTPEAQPAYFFTGGSVAIFHSVLPSN